MKSQKSINLKRLWLKRELAENVFAAALCVFASITLCAVAVSAYGEGYRPAAVICGVGCVASLAVMVWFIAAAVDRACKLDGREFNRR